MPKRVVIVGAGISGLSAGCYLQMNGYDTEIHEMHNLPGGLCTAWQRGGYTIDGCIHWLVGTNPADSLYRLWNEIVDMKSFQFVECEEFFRIEDTSGNCIRVFCDIDRLENEMLEKAPEDRRLIKSFIGAARKLRRFEIPLDKAPELYNPLEMAALTLKFLPFARLFRKWMAMTAGDLAARCKSPLLKNTFRSMFVPEMTALFLVWMVIWMDRRSAGYPVGGSLKFAQAIEQRYLDLGGILYYASRVEKILANPVGTRHAARGVLLDDGTTAPADIVISAADGHETLFEMLEGQFIDERTGRFYEDHSTFPSFVQVSLGLARTFEDSSSGLAFMLDEPIIIDPACSLDRLHVRIFNFDPSLAPQGKTLLTTILPTANWEYWLTLRGTDPSGYKKRKQQIADDVVRILEKRLGHVRNYVEMTDVSTPATVVRYTGNWKGSMEGWLLTPRTGLKKPRKTLRGLDDFYMVGQWVEPGGGLPTALASGRHVAQIICRRDRVPFTTESY